MLSAPSTVSGRRSLRIGSSLLALAAAHAAAASGQPRDPATLGSELMSRDRLPSLSIAIGRGGQLVQGGTSVAGSADLYVRSAAGTVVTFATNAERWTEPRHELALALADWAESF